jgi:hypothetical protein
MKKKRTYVRLKQELLVKAGMNDLFSFEYFSGPNLLCIHRFAYYQDENKAAESLGISCFSFMKRLCDINDHTDIPLFDFSSRSVVTLTRFGAAYSLRLLYLDEILKGSYSGVWSQLQVEEYFGRGLSAGIFDIIIDGYFEFVDYLNGDLVAFFIVATNKGYSSSAKKLGCERSTVFTRVRRIETALSQKLFVPAGGGRQVLTSFGNTLYFRLKEVRQGIEFVEKEEKLYRFVQTF